MAALTIRNLDDETKQALRMQAARHGVSMEQEARTLLRSALLKRKSVAATDAAPGKSFYQSIRALVEPHGGFDIDIPPRGKDMRAPPTFD